MSSPALLIRPARLSIPLAQGDEPPCRPVVEVGQELHQGQMVGRADDDGTCHVHSPCAGRIAAIGFVATACRARTPAVIIETTDDVARPILSGSSVRGPLDLNELAMIADEAGIVSAHGPAFTLGDQFRRAACCRIDTLIINGLEREPLLQVRQCLLEHATVDIIEAAEWLCRAIGLQECRLAVGRKDRRLASHCQASSRGKSVRLVRLASKYPQAAPVLLARTITGRETPCGRTPDHVGVLVVELEPLVALAVAVRENRPMTEVLVTVTGPAVLKHGNYRVPIGMPFVEVLQSVGLSSTPARLVDGGPMTGRAVVDSDAVVTKLTSAILVFDHIHDHVPTPGACIRCGWCQDECPVGLDPLALLDAFERHDLARARGLHVDACLECGLCSALCPSRLPLSEAGTHLKKSVIY